MKESEFYVLRELSQNNNLTQRELSKRLGLSLGSINFVLKALMKKGYIKMQSFKDSDNKAKYIYVLTPKWLYDKAILTKEFINKRNKPNKLNKLNKPNKLYFLYSPLAHRPSPIAPRLSPIAPRPSPITHSPLPLAYCLLLILNQTLCNILLTKSNTICKLLS